jgi:hypothetical protein
MEELQQRGRLLRGADATTLALAGLALLAARAGGLKRPSQARSVRATGARTSRQPCGATATT